MRPTRWIYGALLAGLCAWVLAPFLQALLAAAITAIASWPLYRRFAFRMRRRLSPGARAAAFTFLVAALVLAPLIFATAALITEGYALMAQVADADRSGVALGGWLEGLPIAGRWVAEVWGDRIGQPGTLLEWAQRIEPAAILAWAQSLGHFMARHLFIVLFTVLVLFVLYQSGGAASRSFKAVLREVIGEHADDYVHVATRALRASVNGMLVVALFDGFACGVAFAVLGVPKPAIWAAITGSLALVPFLGYVAVFALAAKLAMAGASTAAALALGMGGALLFFGDKVVRPAVTREGTHLGFAWVLMGCLGGFEALGLVGLVIGPVVLTLVRELWEQRVRRIAPRSIQGSFRPKPRRPLPTRSRVPGVPTLVTCSRQGNAPCAPLESHGGRGSPPS